jgi:hypothetical protein
MWGWLKRRFCSVDSVEPDFSEPESREGGFDANRSTTVLYARIPMDMADFSAAPAGEKVASKRTANSRRRRRRILRFAKKFQDMKPQEARLLFAVHRRTVASLARENSAQLQRDLQRFVLSTRGQRINSQRAAPTLTKVRTWVRQAQGYARVSVPTGSKPQVKAAN